MNPSAGPALTFPCEKCPHIAKSSWHLKEHDRKKHTSVEDGGIVKNSYWTYECTMCPWSSYEDNPVLRHHHTKAHQEDLMPCPYSQCVTKGKTSFKTPEALSKHCAAVHKDMFAMVASKEAEPGKAWGMDATRERFRKWTPPAGPAEAAAPAAPTYPAGPTGGPSSGPSTGLPPLPPVYPPGE